MKFKFDFWNEDKAIDQKEEVKVEEIKKDNLPVEKSMAEILEIKKELKAEIEKLEATRLQVILDQKEIEEDLLKLGSGKEEINNLKVAIIKERQAIGGLIKDIRDEHGFKPSQKEVLEGRLLMLSQELERIDKNDASDLRKLLGSVNNLFPESRDDYFKKDTFNMYQHSGYLIDSLEKSEFKDSPEVVNFLQKGLKPNNINDIKINDIIDLRNDIQKLIDSKGKYKDDERLDILIKRQKLINLMDDIYREIKDIKDKK